MRQGKRFFGRIGWRADGITSLSGSDHFLDCPIKQSLFESQCKRSKTGNVPLQCFTE